MGENHTGWKREKRPWVWWAPAVTGLALCAMAACFAAGQGALAPLERLPAPASWVAPTSVPGAVDLNKAGLEELDTLPGIGPARAQAILDWREEHGPFRYPEQLLDVPGIGEGILEDILDLVTVGQ